MPSRLKVELPVCPEPKCRHIGKQPNGEALKNFCIGSILEGTGHKKRRMVPVVFTAPVPKEGGGS
jgi:hypothetical protein